MTDEVEAIPPGDTSDAAPLSADVESPVVPEGAVPQVGDVTPYGVIFGVRTFSAGGSEISFNGVDWTPAS